MLILTAMLLACSGVPGDEEVRAIISRSVLSDGFDDLFEIENFKKTNGFGKSANVYVVDVEYDLVFRKSFTEVVGEIGKDPTGPQYGVFGSKIILMALQSNFGRFQVGDKIHKQVKVTLNNTENGWQAGE